MQETFTAQAAIDIAAPAAKVWQALTDPAQIKQYLFGTNAVSDWKVGSPLLFKGVWDGKEYLDKGVILRSVREKVFEYTYLSSFSGLPDLPENYRVVTYELEQRNRQTRLKITQSKVPTENEAKHSEENWNAVLKTLKGVVEKQ